MKLCEKFQGRNHNFVELLTTHRHLKCDPANTLLCFYCKGSEAKKAGTSGLVFNNVLSLKSLLYYLLFKREESRHKGTWNGNTPVN